MRNGMMLGTALALAYDENGFLCVQTDGFGKNPGCPGHGVVGSYGLISRPLDADKHQNGAHVLFGEEGPQGYAWLGFDPRDLGKIPLASGGSSGLYNSRGAYFLMDYDTNRTTFYVPVEFDANGTPTKINTIIVGVNGGKSTIEALHSSGSKVSITDEQMKLEHHEGATITFTNGQVSVTATNTINVNAPSVNLGSAPGNSVARVGDLVSVAVPPMIAVTAMGPALVVPANPVQVTPGGGVQAIGQIISGAGGVKS